MEAGREFDALIAERVFGYTVTPYSFPDRGPSVVWYECASDDGAVPLLPYSSYIKEAWRVVEKLHNDGWLVDLEIDAPVAPGEKYFCFVRKYDGEHVTVGEGSADTMPLAICRAALKAYEAKQSSDDDK